VPDPKLLVLDVPVGPLVHVGTELLGELLDRFRQALNQDAVPPSDRIITEVTIG
jgi:hypothetical protein